MKKGSGSAKGHAFERMCCRLLSNWWSNGERDDIFTRTASSGAMATQRIKKGKKQFGQYGDIQAADPIGQPLMNVCVIECKDGYARDSIADLLDKEDRHKPTYESFIKQSRFESAQAGASYWLLIARRRGRQVMIYLPFDLYRDLKEEARSRGRNHLGIGNAIPNARIVCPDGLNVFCTPLQEFIKNTSPRDFKDIVKS
jgi:hypothetical protein